MMKTLNRKLNPWPASGSGALLALCLLAAPGAHAQDKAYPVRQQPVLVDAIVAVVPR